MIITKNWLNEWIDIKEVSSENLCKTLNSIGLEVDSLNKIRVPKRVVVGFVKECVKHPNADKLSICQVDVGGEILQIVCGAKNVREGLFVPVAINGCKLDKDFVIKKAKLRGVESNGMICSSKEIGLPEMNDGILELDESIGELVLGKELAEYDLINDDIIEIELTANRGDCLSIYGVARDLCAAFKRDIKNFELKDNENTMGVGRVLSLASKDITYSTLLYKVFKINQIKTTLLQEMRLCFVDRKSDGAFEIYKNYVNQATGVIVKFYSFNGCEENGKCSLVVKKQNNKSEVLSIGKNSVYIGFDEDNKIKPCDKDELVIVEASYVDPEEISKVAKVIKVKSDKTFYQSSRGSEPDVEFGIKYLKYLFQNSCQVEWYNGTEVIDNRPISRTVKVYLDEINALIGQKLQKSDVVSILKKLGFEIEIKDEYDLMSVKVPLFRHDVKNEQDIVEEIVRITGIDNIKSKPLKIVEFNNQNSALDNYRKRFYFRYKSSAIGFFEVVNYLFTDGKKLSSLGFERVKEDKELLNPVTKELDALRSTLLVGLLESVSRNVKYGKKSIRLFETGTVFDKDRKESTKISFIFSGETSRAAIRNHGKPKVIDFFTFAQDISMIIGDFDITNNSNERKSFLSPYESGDIEINGEKIGYIGRIHLNVENEYDIYKTYFCEIDFDKLKYSKKDVKPYSKFPSLERDFSFLVDKDIKFVEIKSIISDNLPKEIVDFYPIDIYDTGDKESITVRFVLQSNDKTLKDDDIEATLKSVLDKLDQKGIKLR